jgi:hypothetical protein
MTTLGKGSSSTKLYRLLSLRISSSFFILWLVLFRLLKFYSCRLCDFCYVLGGAFFIVTNSPLGPYNNFRDLG